MAQALYRQWRSQAFETVIGQEHVTLTLRNALRDGRMSHAYLFTGPRGTGKTSTARILAKALNCLAEEVTARPDGVCPICIAITEGRLLDLIEIDAASNRGIDEMRDLREKINFRPNEARYRVYIIDEVHMLTKEAFNALLKTLEEPPAHAVFVLATTEPDRVPETVRSRCQRFDFRRIPTGEIVKHLAAIVASEGAGAEQEALVAVARRSTGSMRDAISLIDQLLSYGDKMLTLARVEQVLGLVSLQTIGKLVSHMAAGETGPGLTLLNTLVAEGVELSQLVDQIVAYLRGVLFVRVAQTSEAVDLPQDVLAVMTRQADQLSTPVLLAAVREFTEARAALKDQVPGVPQLPLEIAFLRAAGAARSVGDGAPQPLQASGPAPSLTPAGAPPAVGSPATTTPVAAASAPVREETRPAPGASGHAPAGSAQPPPRGDSAPVTRSLTPPGSGSQAARPGDAGPTDVAATTTEPQPPSGSGSGTPSTEPGDLLGQVKDRDTWNRFLVVVKERHGVYLQAALRGVKQVDVLNGMLVLSFGAVFQRDMIDLAENRIKVEDAWQEVLGRRVGIRCVLAGSAPPAPAKQSPAGSSSDPGRDDDELLDVARKRGAKVTRLE
jgi:DNA polymerase III subunit gamma/tau